MYSTTLFVYNVNHLIEELSFYFQATPAPEVNNIDSPSVEKPAPAEPNVQKEEPAATQQEPAEKTVEIKVGSLIINVSSVI